MPQNKNKSSARRAKSPSGGRRNSFRVSRRAVSVITGGIFVLIFALLGVHLYQSSHAATGTPSLVSGVNAAGNWCMHDTDATAGGIDGSTAPGNPINVHGCNGHPDEYFVFTNGKIKFGADGTHCILPQNSAIAARTTIVLNVCNTNPTEQWARYNGGFRNVYATANNNNWPTGLCLAVTDSDTSENLTLEACNDGGQQNWTAQTFTTLSGAISYARGFAGLPYLFGGGHNGWAAFHNACPTPTSSNLNCRVDCSGLISMVVDAVLHTTWDWTVNGSGYMAGDGSGHWHQISLNDVRPGDIVTVPDHVEFVVSGSGSNLVTFGAHNPSKLDGQETAIGYYTKAFRYE